MGMRSWLLLLLVRHVVVVVVVDINESSVYDTVAKVEQVLNVRLW